MRSSPPAPSTHSSLQKDIRTWQVIKKTRLQQGRLHVHQIIGTQWKIMSRRRSVCRPRGDAHSYSSNSRGRPGTPLRAEEMCGNSGRAFPSILQEIFRQAAERTGRSCPQHDAFRLLCWSSSVMPF
ncbi:hypothetical protein E2C01_065232 [Portunus trituberculatus]|uniref:Uncharacterized protein n=1 Tax=Portunus trituberculatus TaxID=210409 RepID=A0A5B7HLZ2_PORTR|nr:hypothetical protein [Portunus trituberculatus]